MLQQQRQSFDWTTMRILKTKQGKGKQHTTNLRTLERVYVMFIYLFKKEKKTLNKKSDAIQSQTRMGRVQTFTNHQTDTKGQHNYLTK